jgi:glycine cleavage system transcriptional repressor
MAQIAVSALGRDQPGIVAAVTSVLLRHGLNLADSQMGILSGRFTMTLIVEAPDDVDPGEVLRDLRVVAEELDLDTIVAHEVAATPDDAAANPTHIVTVYGVDHPGIVHAVASALAERAVNITDLNTRLVHDEGEEPLYAMLLEVAPPAGTQTEELSAALQRVADEQGVEVTVRELEDEPL